MSNILINGLQHPLRRARHLRQASFNVRQARYASGPQSQWSYQSRQYYQQTQICTKAAVSGDLDQSYKNTTVLAPSPSASWKVRLLYDGGCPLCMKEVDFLRGKDAENGFIDFVDINDEAYNPSVNMGITFEEAMQKIHAILPNGQVLVGIEVFQKLYDVIGLGWVYAITKYEPVLKAANVVYDVWAKYRLPVTGRESLEQLIAARANEEGASCGDENTECVLPIYKDDK